MKKRSLNPNFLRILVMVGPSALWLLLFLAVPLVYVVVMSFCTRGLYGGIQYQLSFASYKSIFSSLYLKVMPTTETASKKFLSTDGNERSQYGAAITITSAFLNFTAYFMRGSSISFFSERSSLFVIPSSSRGFILSSYYHIFRNLSSQKQIKQTKEYLKESQYVMQHEMQCRILSI